MRIRFKILRLFQRIFNFLEFTMSEKMERKLVVIIGAGASGIAAATRLYENGITDILVLEAEDRIGGRVNTIEIESNSYKECNLN